MDFPVSELGVVSVIRSETVRSSWMAERSTSRES
jgi:hypothetical protein